MMSKDGELQPQTRKSPSQFIWLNKTHVFGWPTRVIDLSVSEYRIENSFPVYRSSYVGALPLGQNNSTFLMTQNKSTSSISSPNTTNEVKSLTSSYNKKTTPCSRSIRKYILLTLSHAERRTEINPHGRIQSLFQCNSYFNGKPCGRQRNPLTRRNIYQQRISLQSYKAASANLSRVWGKSAPLPFSPWVWNNMPVYLKRG